MSSTTNDLIARLRKFLDAVGAEGIVLDGIDGGDLFMSIFDFERKLSANFVGEVTGVDACTLLMDLETLQRERDEAVAKLEARAGGQTEGFYLACYKDGRSRGVMTWWRPDDAGYTPYLEQAGVYTAEQIAADQSYYDNAHTVPVPVSFIDGRDSRQVDLGLSKNGQIFWSAKNLRAAISTLSR